MIGRGADIIRRKLVLELKLFSIHDCATEHKNKIKNMHTSSYRPIGSVINFHRAQVL